MSAASNADAQKDAPSANAGGQVGTVNSNHAVTNDNGEQGSERVPIDVTGWTSNDRYNWWCPACATWHGKAWDPSLLIRMAPHDCKLIVGQMKMNSHGEATATIRALIEADEPPPGEMHPGRWWGNNDIRSFMREWHDYIGANYFGPRLGPVPNSKILQSERYRQDVFMACWERLSEGGRKKVREKRLFIVARGAERDAGFEIVKYSMPEAA